METNTSLIGHISNILDALYSIPVNSSNETQTTESVEDSVATNAQSDWVEDCPYYKVDQEDEESLIDDSDDESLCNKLCTFTVTQKEFVNQHWYHCHTCNMIDRSGACTICAKVCHKDHDVSYSRYGSFFCDCAGRENSTCIALTKRAPEASIDESNSDSSTIANNSEQQKEDKSDQTGQNCEDSNASKDTDDGDLKKNNDFHEKLAKLLEPYADELLGKVSETNLSSNVLSFLSSLISAYVRFAQSQSHIGRTKRLQPALDEQDPFASVKPSKRRKPIPKSSRKQSEAGQTIGFPVDFFENLQVITDAEFGGSDLLSVYSVQQLKNRLNTSGLHVTCAKTAGFSVDIINNDPNMVICGIRLQVGVYDITKSPTSVELFGRTIAINPVTARWYDMPLTRDESLRAERKLTLNFGPSSHPSGITTIDSIKVYGKTKENFSWPSDEDERNNPSTLTGDDLIGMILDRDFGTLYQKLMIDSMDCLNRCLASDKCDDLDKQALSKLAKDLSTSLLIVPYPLDILRTIENLLMRIHKDRQNYYQHRDLAAIDFVVENLVSFRKQDQIDSELFTRVFFIMKSLCRSKSTNLTRVSECMTPEFIERNPTLANNLSSDSARIEHLIKYLHKLFQRLYYQKTSSSSTSSATASDVINYEDILKPFLELIYIATLYDSSTLNVTIDVIIGFLLSDDLNISLCTRYILIRLLRLDGSHQDSNANSMLLEGLIEHLPDTREAGGLRSISLLHVILVLTLDLDSDNEVYEAILRNLLQTLREELLWSTNQPESILQRNSMNEVKLVIMRMFSILMSKVRTSTVASTVQSSIRAEITSCWSTFCSSVTASSLIDSDVCEFCYNVLNQLIDYWRTYNEESSDSGQTISFAPHDSAVPVTRKNTTKLSSQLKSPDLSPFFQRQYVEGQSANLFDDYQQLLTEMVLRIPYQIKKVSSSSSNNLKSITLPSKWPSILCEYLMIPIPPYIKKRVRKLLTFICGSKEKYRQLRDFHFLQSHIKQIHTICGLATEQGEDSLDYEDEIKTTPLNYKSMTSLVEHFRACIDIAQNRCINWQVYCLLKDQTLLPFLMRVSLNFGEDVSPIVLELLQHALSTSQLAQSNNMQSLLNSPIITPVPTDIVHDQVIRDALTSESLSANLSQQLITSIPKKLLAKFVQMYLLETNSTSIRWQAHNLVYHLWTNFLPEQQYDLLIILWKLWPNLTKYGRKATQFVDLIGYITLRSQIDGDQAEMFCRETLNVLRQENELLINHPNAHIYSSIHGLVDLESYYLESEPCSVCNSPEIAYNNIKLSSIKVDSRFTTKTQIIKLMGSHTILKFSMRISDIKRSKMVKSISIYYSNRPVQSIVEIKNKTNIWSLARKYPLTPGQTDVKIEFTLPIVACNLMIEFSEFYENPQASSETLQCPRCSTSVSANPGVCNNCGENVFQCHKCRAINYDERDPFLCISCGFCKYARFDMSLLAKSTCAVDPIENEEDRKKTVTSIGNLLEKADRVYKSLMQNKPALEILLLRIHEQVVPDRHYEENMISQDNQNSPQSVSTLMSGSSSALPARSIVVGYAPTTTGPTNPSSIAFSVNKAIQHLAQKYCVECKSLFEELSRITHKVLASRKELVEYDNRQLHQCLSSKSSVLSSANRRKSRVYSSLSCGSGSCYGCATATIDHCVTMLKALSTVPELRAKICDSGIINELVNYNLRNGSYASRQEIRQLICLLTRDDLNSTSTLTNFLAEKIEAISKQDYQPFEISHIVRHEIALLSVTLDSDDKCWELRLRCLLKIFTLAFEPKNPTVMECLVIPCLRLLLSIVKPPSPTTRRHKDKPLENVASVRSDNYRGRIILRDWLKSDEFIFEDWRKQAAKPTNITKPMKSTSSIMRRPSRDQLRVNYLIEKYANRWRFKCTKFNVKSSEGNVLPCDWLKRLLFNRSSKTVRFMTKSLVEALLSVQARRNEIVDLLTSYLDEIGPAGECAHEFYHLYRGIITLDHWRYYLALKGVLIKLSNLITIEIDAVQELEETTLNSSLSLGHSLKMLLDLFTTFLSVPRIRSIYKSKLVGFVLNGYLSLRKLVVQRTKLIDEAQEMLLELLEDMTTGNETETAAFINVCVDAIKKCSESDIRTPIFIFERLCSTIHPDEDLEGEFFVTLEKDPQQEDYLQGRMLNNPYSSTEPGIGPLMKDIKNKICQDCELVALLEDDSSMELLVSNKIISLDLPVRDVYKRIWCQENHEVEAMRIVYRMRGLLGDATEEFIESLDPRSGEEVDEEQAYKLANTMSTSGGLEVMIDRLKHIDDLSPPYKPLLDVILKLFSHCTKTKRNRLALMSADLKAVETLLDTLKLALDDHDFLDSACLKHGQFNQWADSVIDTNITGSTRTSLPIPKTQIVDQTLYILETILREASEEPEEDYFEFCTKACGSVDNIKYLLYAAQVLWMRVPHVSHKMIQVIPFLTFGAAERMSTLIDFFKPSMDFEQFDKEHSVITNSAIDLFCIMVDAIEHNDNGNLLKDFILSRDIVSNSIEYLTTHAPPLRSSLLAASEEWKEFTKRPALRHVLRILAGLSQNHASTQILISSDCIPIVHGLEQVSSDAHVGTLAENLLEVIKQHPAVAEKIELVRRQTREEKKRLAMAVRERQLGALGMKANERGQVTAKSKLLEECQDLAEDTGLICNICREGYKFQPTKVLGIYTYTKRCILDEFEAKPRKSYGYTTVTHFNTVHIDCHMSAVRSARSRDEWESAALQNANTRCNGLLPIWGSQVPESSYASALARHNSYLQDCSGHRDINYQSTIHDIRLQLLRFAQERSFSEDTGGGGPQSNLHLLPYMIQTALYVLNSTRASGREYKRTLNYLEMGSSEVMENCYEVDSPYYWCVLALLVLPPSWWKKKRLQFLQRLIVCNHVRRVNIKPPAPIADTRVRAYIYYKSALIFFAFIDSFYDIVFKDATPPGEDRWGQDWSNRLGEFLKHNDQIVNDNIEVLLNLYQNSFLPCASLERYFEMIRLDDLVQPNDFIAKTLKSI